MHAISLSVISCWPDSEASKGSGDEESGEDEEGSEEDDEELAEMKRYDAALVSMIKARKSAKV